MITISRFHLYAISNTATIEENSFMFWMVCLAISYQLKANGTTSTHTAECIAAANSYRNYTHCWLLSRSGDTVEGKQFAAQSTRSLNKRFKLWLCPWDGAHCGLTSSSVNAFNILYEENNFPHNIPQPLPSTQKLDTWRSYRDKETWVHVIWGQLNPELFPVL